MNAEIKEYEQILDVINNGRPDIFRAEAEKAFEEYRLDVEQLFEECGGYFKKLANGPTFKDIENLTALGVQIQGDRRVSVAALSENLLDYFFLDHAYEHCNRDFFDALMLLLKPYLMKQRKHTKRNKFKLSTIKNQIQWKIY